MIMDQNHTETEARLRRLGFSAQSIADVLAMPVQDQAKILGAYREHSELRGKCGLVVSGQQPMAGAHRYPWRKRQKNR